MKVVVKTLKKTVIEVKRKELEKNGFDAIWDGIRSEYSEDDYDINLIEKDRKNENILFFELTSKV